MTDDEPRKDYTDAEVADMVQRGIYSWSGPSYNPLREDSPELTAVPLFVRVTDADEVRAVFRLVPVFGDAEGVLVDEKADVRVRLDHIEPGDDEGAGDREARRDRPTVATYDAEERAARHLPSLWVLYDADRDIYQFDMRKRDGGGNYDRAGNLFDVRADRLARVMWKLNEELRKLNECTNASVDPDTFTVDLIREGLGRITD